MVRNIRIPAFLRIMTSDKRITAIEENCDNSNLNKQQMNESYSINPERN